MFSLCALHLIYTILLCNYAIGEFLEIKHYDYNFGIPFIDILVGNPPKLQLVVFDTGSSITNVACSPCQSYCDSTLISEVFDPDQSLTLEYMKCSNEQCGRNHRLQCVDTRKINNQRTLTTQQNVSSEVFNPIVGLPKENYPKTYELDIPSHFVNYSEHTKFKNRVLTEELDHGNETCYGNISYIDGTSTSGPFFSDRISLSDFGNPTPSIYYEMLLCYFSKKYEFNGILGAAKKSPYMDYMVLEHYQILADIPNFFGICSSDEDFGGVVTLGGYNSSYLIDPTKINWFPLYNDYHYVFRSSAISTFDKKIQGPWRFIYDSGSTRTILPKTVAETLNEEIKYILEQYNFQVLDQGQGRLFLEISEPTLYFTRLTFYDYRQTPIIEIEPNNLFRSAGNGWWVNNWAFIEGDEYLVLGSLMTRQKYTLLDNKNQNIAFADANCPKHNLQERVLEQQFEIEELIGDLPQKSQIVHYYFITIALILLFMGLALASSLSVRRLKDNSFKFPILERKKQILIDIS